MLVQLSKQFRFKLTCQSPFGVKCCSKVGRTGELTGLSIREEYFVHKVVGWYPSNEFPSSLSMYELLLLVGLRSGSFLESDSCHFQ